MTESNLRFQRNQSPKETAFSTSSLGSRSPLACVQCRRQHLKCDAHLPLCSRCQSNGEECHYVKSRRGGKRIRKSNDPGNRSDTVTRTINTSPDAERPSSIDLHANAWYPATTSAVTAHLQADQAKTFSLHPAFQLSTLPIPAAPVSYSSTNMLESVSQYYDSFHEAHPYILPKPCLLKRIAEDNGLEELKNLILVLRFIGSCYTSKDTVHLSKVAASSALLEENLPKNGFTVQALLLFSLGLTFCGERDRGYDVLKIAVSLALDLGMNWGSFAVLSGEGSPVLEESWRRTWWGLFITDASLAANQNKATFHLFATDTDVPLPCEDASYSISVSLPLVLGDKS